MSAELEIALLPRRLVLRLIADCLDGQARRIDTRSDPKRNPRSDEASLAKLGTRKIVRDRLWANSSALRMMAASDSWLAGADIPADVAGLLCAMSQEHSDSLSALREIVAGLAGTKGNDIVGAVEIVFRYYS